MTEQAESVSEPARGSVGEPEGSRFARFFDAQGSVRALALLRIAVGLITIYHLSYFFQLATPERYFAHGFYVPFFESWPVLSLDDHRSFLVVAVLSAGLMTLGVFTRVSTALTFALVTFNIMSNQIFFHHNRAFLMTHLFCLSLIPCGRVLSVDALVMKRRGAPLPDRFALWRLYLFRALACTPYLASGISKLIDPDWWSGLVMQRRVLIHGHQAVRHGVPQGIIDALASDAFSGVWWKVVVLTEIFIGIGYWFKPTRLMAAFMALGFHFFIEVTSVVGVFSYLGVAAILVWVTPATRDRALIVNTQTARGKRAKSWARAFDWLARFQVEERHDGEDVTLRDRDGTEHVGARAMHMLATRLPLLFPLAAPLRARDVLRAIREKA